jgi:hypothetical protein
MKGQVAFVDRLLLAGADIESKSKVIDRTKRDGLWRSVDQMARVFDIRIYTET